ncbi:MAG: TonB family protein [Saprospiraceae bacterium]|nr:TonB family protein [Saprospiraceae bacterium]
MNFSIAGMQFAIGIASIFVLIVGIIFLLKYKFSHTKIHHEIANRLSKKYDEVDVFKSSGTFWRIGLITAISLSILAFAWTSYETEIDVSDMSLDIVDFEPLPPNTVQQPTLPPPPPPPSTVIETTEDLTVEAPKFVDQTVTRDVSNAVQQPVKTERPKPTPTKRVLPPPKKEVEVIEEVFQIVEEMPRFPGCDITGSYDEKKKCADKKMLEFIYANVKYPSVARENNVEGTAVVSFVIKKDGSISNINVLRDPGAGCGEEAVRIINLMQNLPNKWIPGRQGNENVRVQFNLPIRFRLAQ